LLEVRSVELVHRGGPDGDGGRGAGAGGPCRRRIL